MPQGPVNCPPGLEYLTMIDQLLVHQKVELLEGTVFKYRTSQIVIIVFHRSAVETWFVHLVQVFFL